MKRVSLSLTDCSKSPVWAIRFEPPLTDGERNVLERVSEHFNSRLLATLTGDAATVCQVEDTNKNHMLDTILRQAFDPFDDGLIEWVTER